jgi:hypothetical protein
MQHKCGAPQATASAGDNAAARPCAPGGPRRTRCSLLFCGSARRRVCACECRICNSNCEEAHPIRLRRRLGAAQGRANPGCHRDVDIGLRVHKGDKGLAPQRGHGAPPQTCCQLPLARPCGAKPPPRGLCHVHPKSPRQQATSTFGLALASGSKGCNSYGQRGGSSRRPAGAPVAPGMALGVAVVGGRGVAAGVAVVAGAPLCAGAGVVAPPLGAGVSAGAPGGAGAGAPTGASGGTAAATAAAGTAAAAATAARYLALAQRPVVECCGTRGGSSRPARASSSSPRTAASCGGRACCGACRAVRAGDGAAARA